MHVIFCPGAWVWVEVQLHSGALLPTTLEPNILQPTTPQTTPTNYSPAHYTRAHYTPAEGQRSPRRWTPPLQKVQKGAQEGSPKVQRQPGVGSF